MVSTLFFYTSTAHNNHWENLHLFRCPNTRSLFWGLQSTHVPKFKRKTEITSGTPCRKKHPVSDSFSILFIQFWLGIIFFSSTTIIKTQWGINWNVWKNSQKLILLSAVCSWKIYQKKSQEPRATGVTSLFQRHHMIGAPWIWKDVLGVWVFGVGYC